MRGMLARRTEAEVTVKIHQQSAESLAGRMERIDVAGLLDPKIGASWEGFVIELVLLTQPHDEAWFWGTHQGAEIDLVLRRGDRLYGVECKRADAPRRTPSMRSAMEDLALERMIVIYPGAQRYALDDHIEAVPLAALAQAGDVFGSSIA